MPQRDTVAWNVLISCFLRNKKTRDVFGLFDGLVRGESGCKPDDVTCLLLLQACAELGALEAGDYVLLLNMYSSVGDWDKVSQTRKFMQERGIQTSPGCSSIILKGELHEFVADDVSHPRKKGIYETLDEINEQLKIAGYVTEITSELHSTGEEEKGYVLSYHSEKLAMAFGILATPPGTTIRIAKNLRTCVDCHNFAKAVSWVYNREVVIRDRNRFHHFREGRCSCNDFW
ncbi:Pentatricopeptide repeat-containing protein At3g47530 [Linum perenne]